MDGLVDRVADDVRLVSGERAVDGTKDNPQQNVDLASLRAEARAHSIGQQMVRRPAECFDGLDHVGVVTQGCTDTVAQSLFVLFFAVKAGASSWAAGAGGSRGIC